MSIEIDETIIVPCPLKAFRNRKATHCLRCEYYGGIGQKTVNGEPIEGDFQAAHGIICTVPVLRSVIKIEAD